MLNILSSKAARPSKEFTELKRAARETNLQWLMRAQSALVGPGTGSFLLMVGGVDSCSFRLRVAQSHLRADLSPSFWSHVALLGKPRQRPETTVLYEIALQPKAGLGFPAQTNAVQRATLASYRDARAFPNIALIQLPIDMRTMLKALAAFRKQRATLDAVELLVLWLAYVWGVGRAGNPLLEGRGIPSAAMIEIVTGAAGFDLTPGLESRSSCPEAIWQAARWWLKYYEETNKNGLRGSWHASHFLVPSPPYGG